MRVVIPVRLIGDVFAVLLATSAAAVVLGVTSDPPGPDRGCSADADPASPETRAGAATTTASDPVGSPAN